MGLWQRFWGRRKQRVEKALSLDDNMVISDRQARLNTELSHNLDANINIITELYGNSADLTIHPFKAGPDQIPGAVIVLEGLVREDSIKAIQRVILVDSLKLGLEAPKPQEFYQLLKERLLPNYDLTELDNFDQLCENLSAGHKILLLTGVAKALDCGVEGYQTRAIEEPTAETVIRGPREGFIENIRTNTAMIRRRLKTPNLWIESYTIGDLTRTEINLAYVKGLTNEKLVAEVRSRLQRIDIDGILESGYIEEFIEDDPFTVFPQMIRTERPDLITAGLLEGRIAVFTEGTPFVLLAPINLWELLQAPDDYYERATIAMFIRNLRIFAYWSSILLPGVYVAIVNFHHEFLPTELALRIAATREGVPFPVLVEVLIMELAFEMLREAGIRLPQAIGSAISIVGALILGEAAIRAGLASPAVIIIVAMTAIASFTVPAFDLGISGRLLLFVFLVLGGTIGLFGIQLGLLLLLIHLCSLRSFGTPYFVPLGPLVVADWGDVFIRTWWWKMLRRPRLVGSQELERQPPGQRPRPKSRDEDGDYENKS
jgi:spore germination protein KA